MQLEAGAPGAPHHRLVLGRPCLQLPFIIHIKKNARAACLLDQSTLAKKRQWTTKLSLTCFYPPPTRGRQSRRALDNRPAGCADIGTTVAASALAATED